MGSDSDNNSGAEEAPAIPTESVGGLTVFQMLESL